MKWGCEESEKWEPYLDWRMLACMSETVKKDEWKGGERTRHVDIRATFYQPLDLKDFPFDSHKLEVALVTDSVTDIILCKLNDSVATLHQQATGLMEHSQWKLAQPASINNPIAGRFEVTESTDSVSAKSYCKVTIRMGVHRRHEFMQWNFLFPAFLFGGSALMQWGIPIEAADARIGLGFSLVLALVALKLGIVSFLPTVSYLTFLDKYMISTYVFVIAIAMETSLVSLIPSDDDIAVSAISRSDRRHHDRADEDAVLSSGSNITISQTLWQQLRVNQGDLDNLFFKIFAVVWTIQAVYFRCLAHSLRSTARNEVEDWMSEQVAEEKQTVAPRSKKALTLPNSSSGSSSITSGPPSHPLL